MPLFVVSDLHLTEGQEARLFDDERQGAAFARLAERISRVEGAEVVLLGDIFDLTAMIAPEHGLERFARKMRFEPDPPPPRTLRRLLEAAAAANPRTAGALRRLCVRLPVTIVPGNHDHLLSGPDAVSALAAIGLTPISVETRVERYVAGHRVHLLHGHELDPANATPGGEGEQLTRVLHQAVVPMLRQLHRDGVRVDPDRVASLRPEERLPSVMERWLAPREMRRFFRAFKRLLVENGVLSHVESWLATRNAIRRRGILADELWEKVGNHSRHALRRGDAEVVVVGHTHILDWVVEHRRGTPRLYVNLGTWTERTSDAVGPVDDTMPLLVVEGDGRRLRARLEDLETRRVLQAIGEAGPADASARRQIPPPITRDVPMERNGSMKISDVMTRDPEVVGPDEPIQAVARRMKELDVGVMPVCDGDRILGMITDRDLAIRAVADGADPKTFKASEAMTADVLWCFEDDDLGSVAKKMSDRQVRRMIVVDHDKKLVGIVSLGDLAVEEEPEVTETAKSVLQEVSAPSEPNA